MLTVLCGYRKRVAQRSGVEMLLKEETNKLYDIAKLSRSHVVMGGCAQWKNLAARQEPVRYF